jgi:hypothetical protein
MRSANASDNEGASGDDLSVDIEFPSSEVMPNPLAAVGSVRDLSPLDAFLERALESSGTLAMDPEGFYPVSPFAPTSGIDATAPSPYFPMYAPQLSTLPPSPYQPPELETQQNRAPDFLEKGSRSSSGHGLRACGPCRGT